MDIGSSLLSAGYTGAPYIMDKPVDASGANLSWDEKATLTGVARLQEKEVKNIYVQYAFTKDNSEYGIAFIGGVQVESTDDYVRALKAQAEKDGGIDRYGVTAKEYGRLIDTRV